MKYDYKPRGVCSRLIEIHEENGIVTDVKFIGGCDGNAKGISALVKGMKVDDVIQKLKGITCGYKKTSCPDQLAQAIENN